MEGKFNEITNNYRKYICSGCYDKFLLFRKTKTMIFPHFLSQFLFFFLFFVISPSIVCALHLYHMFHFNFEIHLFFRFCKMMMGVTRGRNRNQCPNYLYRTWKTNISNTLSTFKHFRSTSKALFFFLFSSTNINDTMFFIRGKWNLN